MKHKNIEKQNFEWAKAKIASKICMGSNSKIHNLLKIVMVKLLAYFLLIKVQVMKDFFWELIMLI